MQVNNTTNVHNKSLGFQGVRIDPDLAEFGSGFAKELQKAKQELEKFYKTKVDVYIKRSYIEDGGDYTRELIPTPLINAQASSYRTNIEKKPITQRFANWILGKPIKYKDEKTKVRQAMNSVERFISPEMNSEEIIQAVKGTVKDARKGLHKLFNNAYGTSDVRKAKRILAGKAE